MRNNETFSHNITGLSGRKSAKSIVNNFSQFELSQKSEDFSLAKHVLFISGVVYNFRLIHQRFEMSNNAIHQRSVVKFNVRGRIGKLNVKFVLVLY